RWEEGSDGKGGREKATVQWLLLVVVGDGGREGYGWLLLVVMDQRDTGPT
ncbi:hypothetical protein ACH5RR_023039, partial [Cinchona calisaya]